MTVDKGDKGGSLFGGETNKIKIASWLLLRRSISGLASRACDFLEERVDGLRQ